MNAATPTDPAGGGAPPPGPRAGATSGATAGATSGTTSAPPDRIKAIPLSHRGRNVAAAILLVAVALFLYGAATNEAYSWETYQKHLFDPRVVQAAGNTLVLTFLSMLIGVGLGVVLAIMRLTPNVVTRSVSWGFLWVFRGTPVYVQLVFWGLLSTIYPRVDVGIPFVHTFFSIPTSAFAEDVFWLAVVGLGLNEAAYMAEIVRAGIQTVDEGQTEAATGLGMSRGQTLRLVILPQAMRAIIPPTGNELISMLKTTSLVTAVPYTFDLYSRTRDLAVETFNPVPMLLIACTWYLFFTSILMVGQFYLERYFAKGASRTMSNRQLQGLADAESGSAGGTAP